MRDLKSSIGSQQQERRQTNLIVQNPFQITYIKLGTDPLQVRRVAYFQGAAKAATGPLEAEKIHQLIQRSFYVIPGLWTLIDD